MSVRRTRLLGAVSGVVLVVVTATNAHHGVRIRDAAAQGTPGDDWDVKRDPFDKSVIAKYKAILVQTPHDNAALAKLLDLYRRYRTLELLRSEYQKSASAADATALVVLGRIDKANGDSVRALDSLQKAAAVRTKDAALMALVGDIAKPNDAKLARSWFDRALALGPDVALKKRILRSLADIALAANEIDAANQYFKSFLDLEPRNAQLWMERGDAMLSANRAAVAIESYQTAEKLLGTDPARRVEVVSRLGQAYDAVGDVNAAVAQYQRAIKLAPKGYYLETELTNRIIDIYRRKQDLAGLLTTYESQWAISRRGHFEWSTLGKLYEETGAQDKAITAFKSAAAKAPWEIDTQRRLIALLENSGRDDEALAQFETVVKAAPGEARFALDLADRNWRRGKPGKALESLKRIEARFGGDAGVLTALADMYQRWGQEAAAIAIYQRLVKLEPDDSAHLIALGEQYFVRKEVDKALEIWRRLVSNKTAKGYVRLGEVMSEHGRSAEALDNFSKAIALEPNNPDIYRARAVVQELEKSFANAASDWERVLTLIGNKPTDRSARREARKRLVAVVVRWSAKTSTYRDKWLSDFRQVTRPAAENNTTGVDAGYFLVEFFNKQPMNGEPLATLQKLSKLVPDDQEVMVDLAKGFRSNRQYDDAVATLLALAKAAPSREREAYSQIAEIKTEARQDAEAIEWSQKALAKSPNDPTGYERLAQRYLEMQNIPAAMAAYEKAVALDAKNTSVAFALATLYARHNQQMKAVPLYRKMIRTATDDDVVGRASRAAIDIEEITGTLGELERIMAPLSFVMSHKPVYRYMLVDLYSRYVSQLLLRQRYGDTALRKSVESELLRLGQQGLRPLLEALRDDKDPMQQKAAVDILGYLGNRDAVAPLVRLGSSSLAPTSSDATITTRVSALADVADRQVRIDAIIAAGRIGDATALSALLPLAASEDVAMREAATFAIGRSSNKEVTATLRLQLQDPASGVQMLACMGLAEKANADFIPDAAAVIRQAGRPDEARGACAYALGRSAGALPPDAISALIDLVDTGSTASQRIALWSLAQKKYPQIEKLALKAYFARGGDSNDTDDALSTVIAGATSSKAHFIGYPQRSGRFDSTTTLSELLPPSSEWTPSADWLTTHSDSVIAAVIQSIALHRDVALTTLVRLDQGKDTLALGAWPISAALRAGLAKQLEPALQKLCSNQDGKVRGHAISLLGKVGTQPESVSCIAAGIADSTMVQPAMLAASRWLQRDSVGPARNLRELIRGQLRSSDSAQRTVAVSVAFEAGAATQDELAAMANDVSGYVRDALANVLLPHTAAAKAALARLAHDPSANVRDAAQRSLSRPQK